MLQRLVSHRTAVAVAVDQAAAVAGVAVDQAAAVVTVVTAVTVVNATCQNSTSV
jgi:hypothetical protein